MKFTDIIDNPAQMPDPIRKRVCYTDLHNTLQYFLYLNVYAVKVENLPHNSIYSARASIFRTARRFNLPVRVRIINNELYLINTVKEAESCAD